MADVYPGPRQSTPCRWVDILVSANFRSLNPANALPGLVGSVSATNGASLNANASVPNTVIQASLGRLPGAALANGTTTINLLRPGELYPTERVNQLDMRVAKILRFGGRRADIGIDVYNVLNTSDTTGVRSGVHLYGHGDEPTALAVSDVDRGTAVCALQSDAQFLAPVSAIGRSDTTPTAEGTGIVLLLVPWINQASAARWNRR